MQILVLGMHRSGTSLATRMINMMGAYCGPEGSFLNLSPDNPKGYWERREVVNINANLLRLHNATWPNVAHWPLPHQPKDLPPELELHLRSLIMNMDAHRPWAMKDPRLCLTLPYWLPWLEVPVCVIAYRHPLEIAQSLSQRAENAMPIERGIALWEFYAVSLLNQTQNLPRIFVSHSDFLHDPINTAAQLYNGLVAEGVQGLRLPHAREITAFIDPDLYRARTASSFPFSEYQNILIGMMRGEIKPTQLLTVSENTMKILREPLRP